MDRPSFMKWFGPLFQPSRALLPRRVPQLLSSSLDLENGVEDVQRSWSPVLSWSASGTNSSADRWRGAGGEKRKHCTTVRFPHFFCNYDSTNTPKKWFRYSSVFSSKAQDLIWIQHEWIPDSVYSSTCILAVVFLSKSVLIPSSSLKKLIFYLPSRFCYSCSLWSIVDKREKAKLKLVL